MMTRAKVEVVFVGVLMVGLASTVTLGAQEPTTRPAQRTNQDSAHALGQELDVARAQLASAEEFRSDLLATVYWTLGTVGTLTLALLAFAWFLNLKVSEREREAIRQSLSAELHKEVSEAKKEVREEAQKLRKTAVAAAKQTMSSVQTRVNVLGYEVRCLEVKEARRSDVKANELTAHLKAAKAAHRLNWELQTADALHSIEGLLEQGVRFDPSEMPEVESFLAALPEIHQSLRDRIRRSLLA